MNTEPEYGDSRVTWLLNNVSYAPDPNYIPSDFALEFVNFIKLVNGVEGVENKTPVVHYRMIDEFVSTEFHDTLNMCHRGLAKSTLKEYLILYLGVYNVLPGFGKVPYGLYVSDSIDNGVKKMRKALEYRYYNSDFLQFYIPTVKFTDIRWEFINREEKSCVFSGHGAKTGVRGTRENNSRPVLALLDDLISDADARSPTVIADVEDTIYKAIEFALHPTRRKIIWSGTPFNAKDPLYKAVESGAWAVNVFPVCEHFPCTRADFRGSWEDRFDYDYVLRAYEKAELSGKLDTFYQELMLRIMGDDDRLIQDEEIRWYRHDSVTKQRQRYNFYITTDFATTEEEANDFSVINVWALNHRGDWLWVDGICRRQLMDKTVDDLFRLTQEWRPQSVGIEVSGQQGGFVSWIQREMENRNNYFTLASENNAKKPGVRPITKTNKFSRFNEVVPLIKAGHLFFPLECKGHECVRQGLNELSLVSHKGFRSKHDDFCDTITMLNMIQTWRPSEYLDMKEDDNGIWGMDEEVSTSRISSYTV